MRFNVASNEGVFCYKCTEPVILTKRISKRPQNTLFSYIFHNRPYFVEFCKPRFILRIFLLILGELHRMSYFDDILVHFLKMHKMAFFDGFMFYFGKNSRKVLFRHFCCSFKEQSTVGIILTTFLDILKNWKRQNGPYPFWRARALIWKLHTKGYNEDFSAHFNTMSCICLFWWAFWAIHSLHLWSLRPQHSRFWKGFPTINVIVWRDSRADRSLFWT